MQHNDIIEIKDSLIKMISLLTEIKDLLNEQKQLRESKLPRSI